MGLIDKDKILKEGYNLDNISLIGVEVCKLKGESILDDRFVEMLNIIIYRPEKITTYNVHAMKTDIERVVQSGEKIIKLLDLLKSILEKRKEQ